MNGQEYIGGMIFRTTRYYLLQNAHKMTYLKHFATFSFLIFFCPLFPGSCVSGKKEKPVVTVLKGATLFDGNGNSIPESVIVITNGRIVSIGSKETEIPRNADVVDLSGRYITPGLIDAHVHFDQSGFFDMRPDALDIRDSIDYVQQSDLQRRLPERYFEAYLRSGITAVYDVGGPSWTLDLPQNAEQNPDAPHIAAAGPLLTPMPQKLVGPFDLPAQKTFVSINSPGIGRQAVRENHFLGATGIKIHQLYLQDTTFMKSLEAIRDEINQLGNKMIVHAMSLEQAKAALRLGAKLLVHSVEDKPVDSEFIALLKKQDVIYCPTIVVRRGYLNSFQSLGGTFEVKDPNQVVDKGTKRLLAASGRFRKYFNYGENLEEWCRKYEERILHSEEIDSQNLKKLYEEGITIAAGTDAGNPGTLHGISFYDELEAMQKAGIPPGDIIIMATRNGARAMERLDDFGTLEKGKMADLVVLDKDPSKDISNMRSITHFMKEGKLRDVKLAFVH